MTIIAWDGTTLAADKRAIYGDTAIRTTTKIFKACGALVGYASQLIWRYRSHDLR